MPEYKKRSIEQSGVGARFSVFPHHWTKQFLQQKTRGSFKKFLSETDARDLLRVPLDPRDMVGDLYIKSPNVPMCEITELVSSMKSNRRERTAKRNECTIAQRSPQDWQRIENTLRASLEIKENRHQHDVSTHRCDVAIHKKDIRRLKTVEQENKRLKRDKKKDAEKIEELETEIKSMMTLEDVMSVIREHGGLGRLTIFDDNWHKAHTDAAKLLWGFDSYGETKQYVEDFFPDVTASPPTAYFKPDRPARVARGRGRQRKHFQISSKLELSALSKFEKCLICRLFFRRELPQGFIGLMFGSHRTWIGQVLQEWAPRWGKVAEQITILDVWEHYLDSEEPDRSAKVGVEKAILVDGTDLKVEKKRKDLTINRELYGAKQGEEDARGLTWYTAGGTTFEHTPLFGARASEKGLYHLWGSLGKKCAPVAEWKDVAVGLPESEKLLRLCLQTDNMFKYEDVEELVDTMKVLESIAGAVGDDTLATAKPGAIEGMTGISNTTSEAGAIEGMAGVSNTTPEATASRSVEQESTHPAGESKFCVSVGDIDSWFEEHCAMKEAAASKGKMAPLLTAENLKDQNQRALEGGVNSSGVEKLAQLELHERLHRSHELKKMKKTSLSYYLLCSVGDRHKLLKWMGSNLAPADMPCPRKDDLPDIWLRLAKIPPKYCVLGDKGFDKMTRSNPRLNHVRTPWKLSNVKDYRRSAAMIEGDRATSDTRTLAEGGFARYKMEDVLKATVPYWVIAMLPYAHEWGHADINLQIPYRKPGDKSAVVNREYWKS